MLKNFAAKVEPAAQIMNITFKMFKQPLIVDVLIEEEFETILVRFKHTDDSCKHFHLEPTLAYFMSSIDFARMFLSEGYSFSFEDEALQ